MNSFILISLLCSFSWISVSESQTVDVQPGEDATLQCSSKSHDDALTFWFRLVDGATARCISVQIRSVGEPWLCNGYHKERTDVTTNISTVFLKIKNISVSDAGMYFCGFYSNGEINITVIQVNIQDGDQLHDEKSQKKPELLSLILGTGLAVFLSLVIIGLVVKITKLLKGENEEQDPQPRENPSSDDLNYAAVTFNPGARGRRELEPNVVYAATR